MKRSTSAASASRAARSCFEIRCSGSITSASVTTTAAAAPTASAITSPRPESTECASNAPTGSPLRPAIAAGAVLVALYVVSEFGAVSMLRYDTLTPLMYVRYTTLFDRGAAAVLGLPLIALAIVIVGIDWATRGSARYHTRGQRRPARRLELGAWRWAATTIAALVAGLALVVPAAVIVYWLVRGLQQGANVGLAFSTVSHTAQAAGAAAVLTGLAAIPLAIKPIRVLETRTDGPALNKCLAATGGLLAVYSLLVTIGLLISV